MNQFQIISDSSCDLTPELAAQYNIDVIPFYVSFDSTTYKKEGVELSIGDFYQTMLDNPKVFPKTSLPSVSDFMERFRKYISGGDAVLCICISGKFSGSYNSACTAKNMVLEEYPDAKIEVIDSMVNTCLQGLIVLEAAKMRAVGFSFEEVSERMNSIKESGRIFFTIGSIDYLAHGGRIGKLAGLAASTLGLRPLIQLKEGEIFSAGITRSRKKSLTKTIQEVREHFDKIKEKVENYCFTIGYGHNLEEAVSFREELLSQFNGALSPDDIPLRQIGAAIAVHTGPEAIGVGLLRRFEAPAPEVALSGLQMLRNQIPSVLGKIRRKEII